MGSLPAKRSLIGPVLIVSPWYRPSVGGVVECVETQRRLLSEAGVETYVLVTEEDSGTRLKSHPTEKGVWYLRIPTYFFYSPGLSSAIATLLRAPGALWQLVQFTRNKGVRTLLVNFPSGYAWAFYVLRRVAKVNLITAFHGIEITKYHEATPALRWLTRRMLKNSDAISVCASHMIDLAKSLFPEKQLPIRLMPNSVDIHHFTLPPHDFNVKNGKPTILHISVFSPKKRALDIIEAFAIADLPAETRLVMVGEGPDSSRAKELVRRYKLENRVDFVGAQKDVRPFFWSSDVFVLASEDEGAPLTLLESMASGVPWVSTPWGAAAVLPDGECGLTVPPGSPKQLAGALSEMFHNTERRATMGKRGRARAESDFSGEAYLKRYYQLIEEVERGDRPVAKTAAFGSSEK